LVGGTGNGGERRSAQIIDLALQKSDLVNKTLPFTVPPTGLTFMLYARGLKPATRNMELSLEGTVLIESSRLGFAKVVACSLFELLDVHIVLLLGFTTHLRHGRNKMLLRTSLELAKGHAVTLISVPA
jgi:hypothetical protein